MVLLRWETFKRKGRVGGRYLDAANAVWTPETNAVYGTESQARTGAESDTRAMMRALDINEAGTTPPPDQPPPDVIPDPHPFPITADARQIVGTRSVQMKPNFGTEVPTTWRYWRDEGEDVTATTPDKPGYARWDSDERLPDAGYGQLDNLRNDRTVRIGITVGGVDYAIPFIIVLAEDPPPIVVPPPVPSPTGYSDGIFWSKWPRDGTQFNEAAHLIHKDKPFAIVLEHTPLGSLEEMANVDWFLWQYVNLPGEFPSNVAITVGGVPWGGQYSLKACARGEYDWVFRDQANKIKGYGFPNAKIRILHEPCCYQWGDDMKAGRASVSDYHTAFNRIEEIFHSVSAGYRTVFNPIIGGPDGPSSDSLLAGITPDEIGFDWYISEILDTDARFNRFVTMPYGLDWLKAQGQSRQVPICLPEWGIELRDGHGGDNPGAITRTRNWIKANGAWDILYLDGPPAFDSDIISNGWKASQDAYRATVA